MSIWLILSGICFLAGIVGAGVLLYHILFASAESMLRIPNEMLSPYPTRTPVPTPTRTPTLRPTPMVRSIESGWFGWWGKAGDDSDRRVFMRYRAARAGTPVRVCWNGLGADQDLNWQRLVQLDEPKCISGIVSATYDSPLPTGRSVGAIGAGIRRELLGFDSQLWPLLNVAVFYDAAG